ncbi:MFS general substrate transporter [Auricularia subglabra TFB-10046 SS5]|nr:MFS general substrate transporter [Auricularia subglabra TFB-10046 SS5]
MEDIEKQSDDDVKQVENASPPAPDVPPPPVQFTGKDITRVYRKIDLRLLPMLGLMYLLSFIDRGNIGNAKIQGLVEQLDLTGNRYNIALTMFFIPYCVCEPPANILLKKLRPSRWLPGITVLWGIVMTMMGLVKTYAQLVAVRACLGIAEAGLFPGVVYYLTLWYPRHMCAYRIAIFYSAATIAGAFTGLLAYGIAYMSGTGGLQGWSWIFVLEGLATVVVGVVAAVVLPDLPSTAKFLREDQKEYVLWRKKYDNSTVGEDEHFKWAYVAEAFTDWQLYLHIVVYLSIVTPIYGISLFLPSIINGFGYTREVTQLLTVPPYVFATILIIIFAIHSDRLKIRAPFILVGQVVSLIGFAINLGGGSRGVRYFGTFLCCAAYPTFPLIVAWLGNNVSGHYKRGVSMAAQIGIGNFAGAIASNIYRTQDAPRYAVGREQTFSL